MEGMISTTLVPLYIVITKRRETIPKTTDITQQVNKKTQKENIHI